MVRRYELHVVCVVVLEKNGSYKLVKNHRRPLGRFLTHVGENGSRLISGTQPEARGVVEGQSDVIYG